MLNYDKLKTQDLAKISSINTINQHKDLKIHHFTIFNLKKKKKELNKGKLKQNQTFASAPGGDGLTFRRKQRRWLQRMAVVGWWLISLASIALQAPVLV